jgi:hypothetical protein
MKKGININTYTKRTKQAKDNAAISTIAMSLGKQANDPLAKRSEFFKAKFWEFKRRVIEKYKARARSLFFARKAAGGKIAKKVAPKAQTQSQTQSKPKTSDTSRSKQPTKN